MRKLFALMGVLSIAALSPAPIQQHGKAPYTLPTYTEQQLAEQQKLQKVQPEVGGVMGQLEHPSTNSAPSDPTAAHVLSNAGVARETHAQSAIAILREADQDLKSSGHSGFPVAAWLIGLAVAATLAFLYWLNKNFPYTAIEAKVKATTLEIRDSNSGPTEAQAIYLQPLLQKRDMQQPDWEDWDDWDERKSA